MLPARIIVFAKAPVKGRVKTRLCLDPETALRLHDAFVRDTLAVVARFPEVELSTDEGTSAWMDLAASRSVQASGGLGERLQTAIERALADGSQAVVIVGSDSPTLPAAHIEALVGLPAEVSLGPTDDGGFWGICCRRSHPAMFDGVEWSSPRTLDTTVAALERAGLVVAIGPAWYDIDGPADLARLARECGENASISQAREAIGATTKKVV